MNPNNMALEIVVDKREPDIIVALLMELGMDVERRTITPGDYIISSECGIERKTVNDFMNSVFSGRVFEQVYRLREAYGKPILILEGEVEEELTKRNNPRSFWGALLKLQSDMGIPVLSTPTLFNTANLLYTLVNRIQRKKQDRISIQHKPKLMTQKDWQVYVVASLPSIGGELAERLLSHFGNVRKIFQANISDLIKVEGVGKVKAGKIKDILDKKF